jgi:hypothetical protein
MTEEKTAVGGHAIVTVQLEIVAHSNWGTSCTLEQLYKQGAEDAEGVLRRLQSDRQNGIRSFRLMNVDAIIKPRNTP